MARRPSLIAKKPKKPMSISRSASSIFDIKHVGPEPVFTSPLTSSDCGRAFNWYNYMCNASDAREYTEVWLKQQGRISELKLFKTVPDVWVSTTCGWISRLRNKGYKIPEVTSNFFEGAFADSLKKAKVAEVSDTPKVSIQQKMREKTSEIIGEIEELIDSGEPFVMYDWLKTRNIPATYAPAIASFYAPWLSELIEAHEGKCPQLKEAYRHMTKKQLTERIKFFNTLITDAEKYAGVAKKTRAPRKPRVVSVEKKLKDLKFQKEDSAFKIASVNPEKIIGAQELWTFNTKYKILTVFRALDRGGLDVKGTSIVGYDEKTSCSKRTGRKPEYFVERVLNGGKIVLRKLMEETSGDATFAHRINDSTILLKVG